MEAGNCPKGCSGHGNCDTITAMCFCNPGWTGTDCSLQMPLQGAMAAEIPQQPAAVNHSKAVDEPSVQTLLDLANGACNGCSKEHGVCVNSQCFCDLGFAPPTCSQGSAPGTARGGSDTAFWSAPMPEERHQHKDKGSLFGMGSSSLFPTIDYSALSRQNFVNPFNPSTWANGWGQQQQGGQGRLLPDGSFAPATSSFASFDEPAAEPSQAVPAFPVQQNPLPAPSMSFQQFQQPASYLPSNYGVQMSAPAAPVSATNPFLSMDNSGINNQLLREMMQA